MKVKKTVFGFCLATVMAFGAITTVSAASVNVGACGTMNYGISKSGKYINVYTNITKPNSSSRVRTTTQIQVNATGKRLVDVSRTSAYGGKSASYSYTNNTGTTLACFGAHSVQGKSSSIRYTSVAF